MADNNKKPYFKIRSGGISIACFKNKIKSKDSSKADFEVDSINLQKSWKKSDSDDWDSSSISLRKSDLVKLQVVLTKVLEQQFLNAKDSESEE
jgi:hypothetical protein